MTSCSQFPLNCTSSQSSSSSSVDAACMPSQSCHAPKVLVYSMQPSGTSTVYENFDSTTVVPMLRQAGYDVTFSNRKAIGALGCDTVHQYDMIMLINGCGGATGMPSDSEISALRSYYLQGGSLLLSADDSNGDSNAQGDCQSRVNALATNLGVQFHGIDTQHEGSPPGYCVPIQSTSPVMAGVKSLGRYTAAYMQLLGAAPWGGDLPSYISTLGSAPPAQTVTDLAVLTGVYPAGSVRQGTKVMYSVLVANNSGLAAQNVVVTDTPPAGMVLDQSLPNVCQQSGSKVVCNYGHMEPLEQRAVNLIFKTDQAACGASSVKNTVSVTSDTPEATPGNNSATASSAVQCGVVSPGGTNTSPPDLSIIKQGFASFPQGPDAFYNIMVANNGGTSAGNVTVTDTIKIGDQNAAQLFDYSLPHVCARQNDSVVCNLGTLQSLEPFALNIFFKTDPGSMACGKVLVNSATVSTTSGETNLGNNSALAPGTSITCVQTPAGQAFIGRANGHGAVLFDPDQTSFATTCDASTYLSNAVKTMVNPNLCSSASSGGSGGSNSSSSSSSFRSSSSLCDGPCTGSSSFHSSSSAATSHASSQTSTQNTSSSHSVTTGGSSSTHVVFNSSNGNGGGGSSNGGGGSDQCPQNACNSAGGTAFCAQKGLACSPIATVPCIACVPQLASSVGTCPANACAQSGGDAFCEQKGMTCSPLATTPCIACLPATTFQGSSNGGGNGGGGSGNGGGGNGGNSSNALAFLPPPPPPPFTANQCGNGVVESGEECDDGNTADFDGCSADCLLERGTCGDGVVEHGLGEQCEPSLHDPSLTYGCDSNCHFLLSACGNGQVDPGEQCDLGSGNSNLPGASCRSDCSFARCGDGVVDAQQGEECDDGNLVSGDGCSRTCKSEHGAGTSPLSAQVFTFPTIPGNGGYGTDVQSQTATVLPLGYTSHAPVGATGPGSLAVMAGGAASGLAWVRRKRKLK